MTREELQAASVKRRAHMFLSGIQGATNGNVDVLIRTQRVL
ncbi:hypothetical protein [Edwardsiella phage PVN09]|uniref:Uncharacterized protein n=1 Tax=Edwardsiella phage PVN09 TaxID=2859518 RepID=A0AAE8ATV8_9CAUD|nr:hypothetical protein [Edwardsiella phage PVN09]